MLQLLALARSFAKVLGAKQAFAIFDFTFEAVLTLAIQAKFQQVFTVKTVYCEGQTFTITEWASWAVSSMCMTTASITVKAMNFLNKGTIKFLCFPQIDISKGRSLCRQNQVGEK